MTPVHAAVSGVTGNNSRETPRTTPPGDQHRNSPNTFYITPLSAALGQMVSPHSDPVDELFCWRCVI